MAGKKESPQFADVVNKQLSSTQEALASWLEEHTGYEVDPTTVMLVSRLTPLFRKDPAIEADRQARKAARAEQAAGVEERRIARTEARAAKLEAEARALRDGTYVPKTKAKTTAAGEVVEETVASEPDDAPVNPTLEEEDADEEFIASGVDDDPDDF